MKSQTPVETRGKAARGLVGLRVTLLVAVGLLAWSAPAQAVIVYFNNFETAVGSELTTTFGPGLGIDVTPSGRHFLGRADTNPDRGLSNDTVTLTLMGLPDHSLVTVGLKLFTIWSWDGNAASPSGPDVWQAGHSGSLMNLQNTTFASPTTGQSQCFPADCPASNPGGTGADEIFNSLGYTAGGPNYGDSVYDLSYTVAHTGSTLVVKFTALGLTPDLADESWGIDNLQVDVAAVPEPGTLLLLGSSLSALGAAAWRRRRLL